MSLSMYDFSVPVLLRGFETLSNYLDKAAAYAAENNIDPTVLLNARLALDMQPLSSQVQRASDSAKGAIARLTGIEVPSFPDTETTFEELQERIKKTVAVIKSATPAQFAGSESRMLEMKFGSVSGSFRGDAYLTQFVLPNFFFHLTTAHDILRHNGMKIGKRDYLGKLDFLEKLT
jgi:hypothetical protein